MAIPFIAVGGCVAADVRPGYELSSRDAHPAFQEWSLDGVPGRHVTTRHFDLYTTIPPDDLNDLIPHFLEASYRHFTSIAPPPAAHPQPPARFQTFVFASRAQWDRFILSRFPERRSVYRRIASGGFTERNVAAVYMVSRSSTLSALAHEGMHQYLNTRFTDPLPPWLNEGLAAYCESIDVRRDRLHFAPDRNTLRLNNLRDALITGRTLPLQRLLDTDAGALLGGSDAALLPAYYAQSWALMAFLRDHGPSHYRSGLERLLCALRDGELRIRAQAARLTSPRPSDTSYGEAVFRAFIAEDLDAFELEFDDFMRRTAWTR